MPDVRIEEQLDGVVAGIDEVGRGCWAGPVVAAAMIIRRVHAPAGLWDTIQDSKCLSLAKREHLFEVFAAHKDAFIFGIGQASIEEIDSLNIRQATFLAMQRAAENLPLQPHHVLVDGNAAPSLPYPTLPVVKGDATSLSIAAASIVAKVIRDRLMVDLGQNHPGYGWERNAGYGTAEHQRGLAQHGVTAHHRRSFAPIAALLST
jgi:ribonuclease HII